MSLQSITTMSIDERQLDKRQTTSANFVDDNLIAGKVCVEEEVDKQNSITLSLTPEVYDAFVQALINHNLPLIEHDARSHKRRDAVSPSEFVEEMIKQRLKREGLLR